MDGCVENLYFQCLGGCFKGKRGLLCAYMGQLRQQVGESSSLLPLLAVGWEEARKLHEKAIGSFQKMATQLINKGRKNNQVKAPKPNTLA